MAKPLLDVIKYDGSNSPWLIYKVPGEEFRLGSQLIVGMGQEVLFVKGGKVQDVFTSGTHTLRTGNLPLLSRLVNMPFGGNTPFTAEVYFVNRTAALNMRWGTQNPFEVEDPKYGIFVHIRSYGSYGVRVMDSQLFVESLIGALPHGSLLDQDTVSAFFGGKIATEEKSTVAEMMIKQRISFLEITAYLRKLSDECFNRLSGIFDQYGLELTHFSVASITPPREDVDKLRKMKEDVALGQSFYAQRRSFDIMEKAVENPASAGLANAGIGLGVGMNVGREFTNMFTGNMGDNLQNQNNTGGIRCKVCGQPIPEGQKFCGSCGKPVGAVCPKCGALNPENQKFCGNCGASIANKCASCGQENPQGQKFCGNCGKPL